MYLGLFSEESLQSLHFGRFDCISIDAFSAMSGPLKCQLSFWGSIPPDPKLDPHSQPCYAVCDSVNGPQAYRMLYPTLGNTYNMDGLFYISSSKIMT